MYSKYIKLTIMKKGNKMLTSNFEEKLLRDALDLLSFNEDNSEADFLVVINRLTVLYASALNEALDFFETKDQRVEFLLDFFRNSSGIAEVLQERIAEIDLSVGDMTVH